MLPNANKIKIEFKLLIITAYNVVFFFQFKTTWHLPKFLTPFSFHFNFNPLCSSIDSAGPSTPPFSRQLRPPSHRHSVYFGLVAKFLSLSGRL
ncbi:hypothetical protein VNO80_00442 [Phaseolus coccineus]|uniref:Uncharacterized protein n=1 Tax=Phaseolus coccineus TaxID=3886 RepID=A0AAN9P5E4_PHACN